MTKELVDRLRAWSEESALKQYSHDDVGAIRLVDELAEAANVIERMRNTLLWIASMADESDEWDGVERFRLARQKAIDAVGLTEEDIARLLKTLPRPPLPTREELLADGPPADEPRAALDAKNKLDELRELTRKWDEAETAFFRFNTNKDTPSRIGTSEWNRLGNAAQNAWGAVHEWLKNEPNSAPPAETLSQHTHESHQTAGGAGTDYDRALEAHAREMHPGVPIMPSQKSESGL